MRSSSGICDSRGGGTPCGRKESAAVSFPASSCPCGIRDGGAWTAPCEGGSFLRAGHLEETELAGGDSSAKDAGLTALCHLYQAGCELSKGKTENDRPEEELREKMVRAAVSNHINTEKSSSMGRLFDAVSALLGIREYNSYEGECAIALENAAARAIEKNAAPPELYFPIREEAT